MRLRNLAFLKRLSRPHFLIKEKTLETHNTLNLNSKKDLEGESKLKYLQIIFRRTFLHSKNKSQKIK